MPCYLEIKGTESQALEKKVKENKTMFNNCKSVQTSCFPCQQQTKNEPNKIKFIYGR